MQMRAQKAFQSKLYQIITNLNDSNKNKRKVTLLTRQSSVNILVPR